MPLSSPYVSKLNPRALTSVLVSNQRSRLSSANIMDNMVPSSEDIASFMSITNAERQVAIDYLEGNPSLEVAVSNFFAGEEPAREIRTDDEDDDHPWLPEEPQAAPTPPAPAPAEAYTLAGTPVSTQGPMPAGWGAPARNMVGRVGQSSGTPDARSAAGGSGPRIATLGTVGRQGEELYAGGEKSGLAVQNPNGPGAPPASGAADIVGNIIKRASQGGPESAAEPERSGPSRSAFSGSGNTLGSEDKPSVVVPDLSARRKAAGAGPSVTPGRRGILRDLADGQDDVSDYEEDEEQQGETQKRRLTFWKDGFSIEDGPLFAYDAPGSQQMLQAIDSGHAPLAAFGVRFNQPLEVIVVQRTGENYVAPPPRPIRAFEGQGNRLGAPTPQITSSSKPMPGAMPQGILQGGQSNKADAVPREFSVDESKPATKIQIRLGDGTRLAARVNLTHTVGDLRNFIDASRPETRSYALQTTFPNRDLADDSETIEHAKLQNAVVVQRWL